jgi:hypothetical protein
MLRRFFYLFLFASVLTGLLLALTGCTMNGPGTRSVSNGATEGSSATVSNTTPTPVPSSNFAVVDPNYI